MALRQEELRDRCPVEERAARPVVRALDLAALRFASAAPETTRGFFRSFGLVDAGPADGVLYLRGAAPAPYCVAVERDPRAGALEFRGSVFTVAEARDLERLAELPESEGRRSEAGPGDRTIEFVRLRDPDGWPVDAALRADRRGRVEALDLPRTPLRNSIHEQKRQREAIRPPFQPARVHSAGALALGPRNVATTAAWHQSRLGLIVSDMQFAEGEASPGVVYLRPDRGRRLAPHHCLALHAVARPGFLFAGFNIQDLDELGVGARWMEREGLARWWGPGRRLLSSALFDFWRGPGGLCFEKRCDEDVFDNKKPVGYMSLEDRDAFRQWGPAPPADLPFIRLKPVQRLADWRAVRRRFRDPADELSPQRLASLRAALRLHLQ